MTFIKSNKLFPLLIIIVLFVSSAFFYYKITLIPEAVAKSTERFINVDSLRFIFKVGSQSQKGYSLYVESLHAKDTEVFAEAVDAFNSALAFLDITYATDLALKDQVLPKIERIISLIEAHQFSSSPKTVSEVKQLVDEVFLLSSNREREVWEMIQSNYIDSITSDYTLSEVYKVLAISLVAFLLLGLWHLLRQRKLMQQIQKDEVALERLAYFDPLTELPNRKHIEQILTRQVEQSRPNAKDCFTALIDIDDFKRVNDLLGHAAGDALIKLVSQRLLSAIRTQDSLGRLGGDEFLLVFSDPVDQNTILSILERVQEAFIQPLILGKSEFYVSISTGVAHLKEIDAKKNPVEEIIKFADIAMYEAKRSGKNRFYIYDSRLGEEIEKEHQLDVEIKHGLEHHEFELYYQPKFSVVSQKVCGVEALIRWHHPQKGFLMPYAFIDVVEKGGNAKSVGEWVIKQAVKQQKAWFKQGLDVSVSINLSVKHILSPDFFQSFTHLMHFLQADIDRIYFEITEYELIEYQSHGIDNLKQMVNAGYKLHLDDFGTGYSSISYLGKLPLHAIKIDKSFVDHIDHPQKKGLVEGILTLAQALGLEVIAEGVETATQAEFLMNKGCDFLQGYLIAKPMDAASFVTFCHEFKGLSSRHKLD